MLAELIPAPATLLTFTVACIILVITPGPDMTLFLSRTLTQGRAAGVASTLGASTGILVHTSFAAFGLSALLVTSATAFEVLKIVGALYLLWLAVDAIRNGSALNARAGSVPKEALARIFAKGILINLLNPKVVLFFVTFLPQFVDAADPNAAGKLLFLGLYFNILSVPITLAMVWGAGGLSTALKARPRLLRALDYGFAGLFGGFALKLMFTRATN
jgi:threonine/homoserine/homoserine lactone efflux protein